MEESAGGDFCRVGCGDGAHEARGDEAPICFSVEGGLNVDNWEFQG